MSGLTDPSDFTREQLQQRSERLAYFLKNGAPAEVVDEAVSLLKKTVERWEIERKAGDT